MTSIAFDHLIPMCRSRKKPKAGDVFIVQPEKGIFYFGKVIQTDIVSSDSFINGMSLIYIYNRRSSQKNMTLGIETEELLIPPIVVNNQPWVKGYFETIGFEPVTVSEEQIDYGFWHVLKKEYVDLNGLSLSRVPKYSSIFGLGSYGIVGKEVQKAINGC